MCTKRVGTRAILPRLGARPPACKKGQSCRELREPQGVSLKSTFDRFRVVMSTASTALLA
jgi:hypothetical protein